MTPDSNPISPPTMMFNIFKGYYYEDGGDGVKIINEAGFLTEQGASYLLDKVFSEGNVTLYARWSPYVYNITLNPGNVPDNTRGTEEIYHQHNGELYLNQACSDNKEMSTSSNPIDTPSKPGYNFTGYYLNGKQIINSKGLITNNYTEVKQTMAHLTLTAQWEAAVYTITLNHGNVMTNGTEKIYQKYNDGFYLDEDCNSESKMTTSSNPIERPVIPYEIFKGYYLDGVQMIDASGHIVSGTTPVFVNNITLTPQFEPAVFKRILDLNGGYNSSTDTTGIIYKKGDECYLNENCTIKMTSTEHPIPLPQKEHYIFEGYYYEDNTQKKQIINSAGFLVEDIGIPSTITLKAHWTPKVYEITLDPNGGTNGTSKIYQKYEDGVYLDEDCSSDSKMSTSSNKIKIPEKEHYIFGGYFLDNQQVIASDGSITLIWGGDSSYATMPAGTKLVAKWSPIYYKVHLELNGGTSTISEISVNYDSYYGAETIPVSRDGYKFDG